MKSIIFKSEKKAKCYEIRAAVDFGVYKQGGLIRRVRTDDIDQLNQGYLLSELTITEIPNNK